MTGFVLDALVPEPAFAAPADEGLPVLELGEHAATASAPAASRAAVPASLRRLRPVDAVCMKTFFHRGETPLFVTIGSGHFFDVSRRFLRHRMKPRLAARSAENLVSVCEASPRTYRSQRRILPWCAAISARTLG